MLKQLAGSRRTLQLVEAIGGATGPGYIVTEKCWQSLDYVLKMVQGKRDHYDYDHDTALHWVMEMLEGYRAVEEAGALHNDLHPGNWLLRQVAGGGRRWCSPTSGVQSHTSPTPTLKVCQVM
jgi:hypothetical protein